MLVARKNATSAANKAHRVLFAPLNPAIVEKTSSRLHQLLRVDAPQILQYSALQIEILRLRDNCLVSGSGSGTGSGSGAGAGVGVTRGVWVSASSQTLAFASTS